MKSMTNSKNKPFRRTLMATACALALGAPAAFAQTAKYTVTTLTQTATLNGYIEKVLNNQIDTGTIITLVDGSTFLQILPVAVIDQTAEATSTGNFFSGFATVSAAGANKTLGVLSGQIQTGTTLTATANSITGGRTLTGQPPTVGTVTDNTIQAVTTVNSSDLTIAADPNVNNSGKLLSGYNDTTQGSLVATETGGGTGFQTTTTGSLVTVSNQIALDSGVQAGSGAAVTASSIELTTAATTGGILDQNQTLSSNTIAAQFQANTSSNSIAIAKNSPALQGSAAVGNFQGNLESGAGPTTGLTASVTGSSITGDFRDGNGGATTLSAAFDSTGNGITAASSGNTAANSLTLGKNVNLAGTGSDQINRLSPDSTSARVSSDLALLSVQGNANTGLNSQVDGGTIQVFGDNVGATGALTLSSNAVASSAEGNRATSLIQTQGTSLTGSVAAGNLQINDATTLTSVTSGADISSNIGLVGTPASGSITLDSNIIGATSTGSNASTTVQLNATNLALAGTATGADINLSGDGDVRTTTGTGATATNLQANYGSTTPISASVSDSNVRANFVDQVGGVLPTALDGATVTATSNQISASATGNTAATSLTLGSMVQGPLLPVPGTTDASGSGAVASGQINQNPISASVTDSGVRVSALESVDSTITADGNLIGASGAGNVATNSLSSTVTNLTVNASPLSNNGALLSTVGQTNSNDAALAVGSSQLNSGNLTVSNTSTNPFVLVDIGGAQGGGVNNTDITVSNNQASATGSSNLATNNLTVNATNTLATSNATAGQVAAITNLQQNTVAGTDSALLQKTGGGVDLGIEYDGPLVDSNLTVSGNTATASITGNTAGNTLAVSAASYGGAAGATSGRLSADLNTGLSRVNSEFAIVNSQADDVTGGRTATVTGLVVGVDAGSGGNVTGSDLTVSGNTVLANARNNDAASNLSLTGTTSLSTGAGVVNSQSSSTDVTSLVSQTRVRIQANGGTVDDSNLTLADNTVATEAVGNAASNSVSATSANITGNANVAAPGASVTGGPAPAVTVSSDFGVGSVQNMTGDVSATTRTSMRINIAGSDITGGALTMTGNAIQAIGQSNSVSNAVNLTGTGGASNIAATATVASVQNATGEVRAIQTTPGGEQAFAIFGLSTTDTPLVVSGNNVLASGGQNESSNSLTVNGVNVSGAGLTGTSTSNGLDSATTGADFAVLNLQTGTGTILARATPGLIGVGVRTMDGGSATVSDNVVVAMATVNNAGNSLLLNGITTLNATAAVNNTQVSDVGSGSGVQATVQNATVGVGSTPNDGAVAIDGTPLTVANNLLTASAGGNTATNSLTATSKSSIGGSLSTTFDVLNNQLNAAGMTSLINNVTVGLPLSTSLGGTINNSNVTVTGNRLLSLAYGNSASNSLVNSALTGTNNASSASISNFQNNTGTLSASITGASIGATSPGVTTTGGVTGAVVGNSLSATAVGNSATSSLIAK